MNEKSNNSDEPPKSLANLPSPRRSYSTHPRVQKAFRRLVEWAKYEEQQRQLSSKNLEDVAQAEELELPRGTRLSILAFEQLFASF